MKDRTIAAVLALLLGGIGIQHFYLNQPIRGILDILFCWTFIPAIIGLIEGIIWLCQSDEEFESTHSVCSAVVASREASQKDAKLKDIEMIVKMKSLLDQGVITQEEFDTFKQSHL